jgi:hypothetical protein
VVVRSDALLAALVLLAAALVLAAPVAGRAGHPRAADAAMALAAVCGLGAFVWTALVTLRAARRGRPRPPEEGPR